MENYKNINIANLGQTEINQVKAIIDNLQATNYELYEVIITMQIGLFDHKLYYTTCLHENNNQTLILN